MGCNPGTSCPPQRVSGASLCQWLHPPPSTLQPGFCLVWCQRQPEASCRTCSELWGGTRWRFDGQNIQ